MMRILTDLDTGTQQHEDQCFFGSNLDPDSVRFRGSRDANLAWIPGSRERLTYGDPLPVGGVRFAAGEPPLQRTVGNPPVKVGRHPTLRDGAQADALICKQTDRQSGIVCAIFFASA
jgi:hypothetical protein